MQKVIIADKEYTIACNIGVLMDIQDKYNTLTSFELGILGLKETGKFDKNGSPIMKKTEPSIRMIYDILPLMLKAGGSNINLAYDALDFNFYDMAHIMHEEFKGCFNRKNQQSLKTTGRQKSIKK